MRVFYNEGAWGTKLNFVDEDNVILGFKYDTQCCEDFGAVVTRQQVNNYDDLRAILNEVGELNLQNVNDKLESFVFDRSYCKKYPDNDDGEFAVFKADSFSKGTKFIILYNFHNGYYGHGFEMKVGDLGVFEGVL